jgi:DNA repair exonuclease SbcCD ATPase subunit
MVERESAIETCPAEPDGSRVAQLARDALAALRAAQEQVRHDAEELQSQWGLVQEAREQLAQQEAALETERSEWEGKCADQSRQADEMQRTRAAERELDEGRLALEPERQELQRWRDELAARAHEMDARACELAKARDAMAAMQAQVTRDNEEIAIQRDELLQRLGSVPLITIPSTNGNGGSRLSTSLRHEPVLVGVPKPAGGAAAEQFRKLRRDAKRRAIGV